MSEPERLPDELRELLDAERDIEAPHADTRARLFARLAPLVVPGAIGAGLGAGAAAAAGSAGAAEGQAAAVVGSGLKAKLVIAGIAGVVGAFGGAVTHAALTPAPSVQPAPSVSVAMRAAPTPAAVESVTPPLARSAEQIAAPSASIPTKSSGTPAANLRGERLLLERASAALMRGDATSALAALREHARKFPRGALAEEREVLLVRALRAAGQEDAAQKRAKEFKGKFPSSLQQGNIDEQ